MPVDLELWNKLKDFALDDALAQFNFTGRLAHENGWPKSFAKGAVDEYKKFVYLAATSETPVTPSDIVDQVWHLHLTFTRSYWDDMCAKILGHPLHHGPTKGGAREDAKYRKQYAETLALYRSEFGVEPPKAYWPPAEARFASAPHQRWVDARTHFIIRKPKFAALRTAAAIATASAATTSAAAASGSADGGDRTTMLVLGGATATAVLLFGTIFSGSATKRRRKGKDDGGDGGASFVATSGGGTSGKGHGHGDGAEGGEGGGEGGGDGGGGDGGGGCGGGGGCSS